MARTPFEKQALTLEKLRELLVPHHVFYRPAVEEIFRRNQFEELQAFAKEVRAAKQQYGDFDKLIAKLEGAAKKAQG